MLPVVSPQKAFTGKVRLLFFKLYETSYFLIKTKYSGYESS